jgi:hypothetical protein
VSWCLGGKKIKEEKKMNGVNPKIRLVMVIVLLHTAGIVTAIERHIPSQYPTIQAAIDAAVNGDTVIVAPGTYTGPGNRDIDFLGKAITVRSENGPENCIIDCNGTLTYPHRGFYFHSGEGPSSVLAGLTITKGYEYDGGGIYNDSSSPMVTNCIFSNDSAVYGGGMNNFYSSTMVTNCTFNGNWAQYGGGVDNDNSNASVVNCTFTTNTAYYGGGMFNGFCNSSRVEGCTFSTNLATHYGGGIYNWRSNPTVGGCTFSRNSAEYGGGICNQNNNNLTLTNCILWVDVPSEISEIYGGTLTVTYSDVQGGCSGIGNINADPCFVNPESNDFHLQPKSPCINAGDPNYVPGPNGTDMDGEPRVINSRVDIGADEFNYEGPVLEISPREFDFYCPEGGPNPEAQVLSIRIRGTDLLNWNVTEDCFWLQASPAAGNSAGEIDEVVLSVDANGLDAGEYSCILTVSSPDAINTPQYVTINLHVKKPIIGVKPTAFEFSCAVGSPNPKPQILSIWNADIGTLNWQISEECSWLQADPIIGSSTEEVDEVTLSVDANGLEAGEYSCILTVSSPDAINTPQYVTINLHVKKTLIGVNPTKFEFSCPLCNPNPKPQILSIRNASIGILNWQIIEDCSWLQASPTVGSSTGDINKVTLTFDAAGLPCGHYTCDLTVSDDAAGNSPVTVPVTLIIYLERQLYVPADFSTIQAAIDNANNGDTIIVDDGIYTGNGNCDIDFRGKAITVCSENGPENCIIDCNGTEGKLHTGFIFRSGEDVNAVLDGFTIINGYAMQGGGISCGVGMFINNSSNPTISNCSIIGNSSERDGGGVFCSRSSPVISNCTISGNKSKGSGGGICCIEQSNPTISNCSIIDNSSERDGGGIACLSSSPTITNCIISANKSKHYGGGMFNGGIFGPNPGNPTVTNCIFTANRAYYGGGMYNPSSSSTVTNCILWADVPSEIIGGTPIVTYSDVQGGYSGIGNINADPCFVQPPYLGPISYWKFDEGSGTTAYDSAGTNNGTVYGATWTTGRIDGALNFDGVNDFVRVPNNQGQQITTNQITLSAWIKLDADVGNTLRGIICEQGDWGRNYIILWGLEIFGDGYGGSGGNQLVFLDSDGQTAYHTCMSPTDLNLNQWYHVAVTDNAGVILIYLDGEPDWSCDKGYGIPSNITAPIFIGAIRPEMYSFFGTIDDVRIYDRALSDEEIRQLYQNGTNFGDYHLRPDSPCINAGDPNYISEPNETDIDGEQRVMFGRIDMGADEFNPIRLGIVNKKRVARTQFIYDCNATFTNLYSFAVKNVEIQMMQASENMTIIEPNVTFGDIQFNARQSITSIDTCTFKVDRSKAIEPEKIVWKVKCQRADTGMPIELTCASALADDGKIGFEDLAELAGQWLWVGPAGSIPEDITGDGIVNLRDFAVLAEHRLEGR